MIAKIAFQEVGMTAGSTDDEVRSYSVDQPTQFVARSNVSISPDTVLLTLAQRDIRYTSDTNRFREIPDRGEIRVLGQFAFPATQFAQGHVPLWIEFAMRWAARLGNDELIESIRSRFTSAIERGIVEGQRLRAEDIARREARTDGAE